MARWRKPVRLAVGVFGIACAVVVYVTLGERPQPASLPPLERIDPAAVLESTQGVVEGLDEGFELRFATMATYPDGRTRLTDVQITTPDRDGRSFVVTAGEAHETTGTREQRNWELQQDVRLRASDGFELVTDRGSYDEAGAVVRAAGAVTFGKGRMSGSGRGMTYDLTGDVLRVSADARVEFAGGPGADPTLVSAGAATLDRPRDTLQFDTDVEVMDPDQVMLADHALARLSPEGGHVTFVELRGRARVDGTGALDAMQARAIDLDYTEDGAALERATLEGDASLAMDGTSRREFSGGSIDVGFDADGAVDRASGRTDVSMVLPESAEAPARRIESSTFDAAGRGGVLENIRFGGDVVFREEAAQGLRIAHADALAVEQDADGRLTRAVFTGRSRFEEGTLRARASDARYEPARGMLILSGQDARGEPSVEDGRVLIDARDIEIALGSRRVAAEGSVRTTILAEADRPRRGSGRGAPSGASSRPGLLAGDQAVRITAGALTYDGERGVARYAGSVRLWQKETDMRADMMDVDLEGGDLTARGRARAVLVFESGRSEGEADEIAYDDRARRVTYAAAADSDGGSAPPRARVTGPFGDLRAPLIAIVLAETESRLARLTAERGVEALVEGRRITGAQLEYRASDERYVVSGDARMPVRVRVSDPCRELVGRTLIYSRAADTMQVDGSTVARTQATRSGSCQ